MPTRVYVVDDDRLVTTSLGLALRLETDWEVVEWNDTAAALGAMTDAPPEVVLSDLKMPGLDGIAFLKRVRASHPDAVLLLLTGYADKESAIAAINEVGIWQYVEKPWDTNDLIIKVQQGLERRDLAAKLRAQNAELAARISDLEEARQRLVSSERLAAVGRVMAGLAHEMGNQLGLMGYAQLIIDKTSDVEIGDYAGAIIRAQQRLGAMVGEIKDFVRSPDGRRGDGIYAREVDDVAAVVGEAVALVRFDRDARDRVIELTATGRPLARLHRGKIMQAVINLVRNAVQASPPGGRVSISVTALPASAELVADASDGTRAPHEAHDPPPGRHLHEGHDGPDAPSGQPALTGAPGSAIPNPPAGDFSDGTRLEIVDHGAGIRPEVMARLGEPFFTTREGGTGLGLGITRRIIVEHGGELRIASVVGEGTRVEVLLPPAHRTPASIGPTEGMA